MTHRLLSSRLHHLPASLFSTAAPSITITTTSATTPAFQVSDSCASRIAALSATRATPQHLRVSVDAGGCSGFEYVFEVEDRELREADDVITTHNDEVVVTDPGSLSFLRGAKVDFVEEMIRSSFAVVENPNSESACGCGSSFALKNFGDAPAVD